MGCRGSGPGSCTLGKHFPPLPAPQAALEQHIKARVEKPKDGAVSLATLAAVLLRATEVILIVGVGVGGGAGVAAHGALPLPLQDTRLGNTGCAHMSPETGRELQ